MQPPASPYAEHAEDVLAFAAQRLKAGTGVALATVTGTLGGAVRAPGALMAVDAAGTVCGYLSGGCIDADLAMRARSALEGGYSETVRYGVGSPFQDIALPCGGAIDVAIDGAPSRSVIDAAHAALANRQPASIAVSGGALRFSAGPGEGGTLATYHPKLRLRLAGRGADPIALLGLAMAAGHGAEFWTPDKACASSARSLGLGEPVTLTSVHDLPRASDDPWTAFVLMFHDADWEDALLAQALDGSAFYIGAVGSARTHAARCDRLLAMGVSASDIDRIKGPVGVLPSMRNASALAVSTLAEIVGAYAALPAPAEFAEAEPA